MVSMSTLLSLVVAGGVGTAAFVLWRSARLPRVVRMVAVLLALYSVGALLYGISAGVPFKALFSGDSFWKALPFLLQGATVGGLIVVPAALVVAVVRLGTRRPRPGSAGHAAYQAIALAMTLAIVVAALPYHRNGSSVYTASAPTDDAARRLAIVENSLRAIEEGDRQSPRDRWDPTYVVEQVGKDPAALFAWMQDNTAWVPYVGTLRGPVGVLMDRRGNSLDRAILLSSLLEAAGHTVRLAHGELSRPQALALLPILVARQSAGAVLHPADLDVEPEPDVTEVAAQYQLDGEAIQRGIDARDGRVAQLVIDLQTRVVDQANRLLSLVTPPDADTEWLARYQAALDALRDHWWVQRAEGGAWVDMDLLASAGSASALVSARDTMAQNAVPSGLRHEVAVRLVLEHWANGPLAETRVLEHVLRPSDLYGKNVVLQFWPRSLPGELSPDPNSPFGLRTASREQREWTAALLIDRDVAAQAVIQKAADSRAAPASGNPLGGLGGAISGFMRESAPSAAPTQELTAAWVEYEIRAPGGPARNIRRVVFDLLGTASRSSGSLPQLALSDEQQVTRSLSLMMRTEILAAASELAPEFVTHLAARSLVGNRDLLRALTGDDVEPGETATEQLLANAAPAVTPLYAVALARTEWRRAPDSVFADRVGIVARHRYPAYSGENLILRDAIDIVANEMGVTLAEPDAFVIRLEQGVLDTNAEALLHANAPGVRNTAQAFTGSENWIAVTAGSIGAAPRLELHADAQRAIAQAVERGYSVIVPTAPVPAGSERYVGWWRIDAATGDTLGVAENGWGQAMAERGVQYNVMVEWAKTFAFEYAFCQAVPQVMNQAVAFLQPYRDELPPWLPPLAVAQDPGKMYAANKKQCLIGAMIATGVTATLPLLLIFLRATAARWAGPLARFWRDQRGGIRLPPGLVRRQVRGGPPVPEPPPSQPSRIPERGLNPYGKTQPDPFRTQRDPGAAPPAPAPAPAPASPTPLTPEAARANLKQAAANSEAAYQEYLKASSDSLQYGQRHPNSRFRDWADNPGPWEEDVSNALKNEANQKQQAWQEANQALYQAQMAAKRAQAKGGFPPPQPSGAKSPSRSPSPSPNPGCPPNCGGNNNPTVPGGAEAQVQVGAGGLSGGS